MSDSLFYSQKQAICLKNRVFRFWCVNVKRKTATAIARPSDQEKSFLTFRPKGIWNKTSFITRKVQTLDRLGHVP